MLTVKQCDVMMLNVAQAPDTSSWLRAALRASIGRDPVDALHDARRLVDMLTQRYEAIRVQS